MLYQVRLVSNGNLYMIAPLSTIAEVFRLHKDACRRIEREAPNGCLVWGNGRHLDLIVETWAP